MIEETKPDIYNDISDEAIGAAVRKFMQENRCTLATAVLAKGGALGIVRVAHEVNSTKTTINVSGVTLGDEHIGDWEVVCRRIK